MTFYLSVFLWTLIGAINGGVYILVRDRLRARRRQRELAFFQALQLRAEHRALTYSSNFDKPLAWPHE